MSLWRWLWRWLWHGSGELMMPKSWLADTDRLAAYEAWTARQAISRVEKDTAHFARQAFWQAREQTKPTLVRRQNVSPWKVSAK